METEFLKKLSVWMRDLDNLTMIEKLIDYSIRVGDIGESEVIKILGDIRDNYSYMKGLEVEELLYSTQTFSSRTIKSIRKTRKFSGPLSSKLNYNPRLPSNKKRILSFLIKNMYFVSIEGDKFICYAFPLIGRGDRCLRLTTIPRARNKRKFKIDDGLRTFAFIIDYNDLMYIDISEDLAILKSSKVINYDFGLWRKRESSLL